MKVLDHYNKLIDPDTLDRIIAITINVPYNHNYFTKHPKAQTPLYIELCIAVGKFTGKSRIGYKYLRTHINVNYKPALAAFKQLGITFHKT